MNDRDFAIVVGISKYPGFGVSPNEPAHLHGPDRDAMEIYEWLTSEKGGDVPAENVELICSSKFPYTDDVLSVEPQLWRIQKAFQVFALKVAQNRAAGKDIQIGRRLYIYMSGHGFAPSRYKGGLFLANATSLNTQNIYASGWLEWFQDTRCFDEFVLWMDCCMDREFTLLPEAIPLRMQGGIGPPGPTMIAFAAPRPLKTIETKINGQVRGVFTYTLLQGLKGAAADPHSLQVTARSLGDYLLNAMKGSMPPADVDNPGIAKEPEIVKADAQLILAAPPSPAIQKYVVHLTLSEVADGTEIQLWGGTPPAATLLAVHAGNVTVQLPRGLYLIGIPVAGVRQGFEVSGSGAVEIKVLPTSQGTEIKPAHGETFFSLEIDPDNKAAEIFVIDHRFSLVARGRGWLKMDQPYGLYKIKVRSLREIREEVILLDSDSPIDAFKAPPQKSAMAPAESKPAHANPETAPSIRQSIHVYTGIGAEILVMVHPLPNATYNGTEVNLGEGVTLLNSKGQTIADLAVHGEYIEKGSKQPFVACNVRVTSGTYFLRQRLPNSVINEQAVIAHNAWRTEITLEQATATADPRKLGQAGKLMMRRIDSSSNLYEHDPAYERLIEAACIALADDRKILSDKMRDILVNRFDNPLAGIIGGHLLLIEAESYPQFDRSNGLEELDEVVSNLRTLVGNTHPDVESLSQYCRKQELRSATPLHGPPLFARSWQIAVAANDEHHPLVSPTLWEHVRAITSHTPYFVWAVDRKSRSAHADQIMRQLAGAAAVLAPAKSIKELSGCKNNLETTLIRSDSLHSANLLKSVTMPSWSAAMHEIIEQQTNNLAQPIVHLSTGEADDEVFHVDSKVLDTMAQQWNIPSLALAQLVKKRSKRIDSAE